MAIITNPGFEDGDFTGWTTEEAGVGSSVTVEAAAKKSGTYGARTLLECEDTSGNDGIIMQNIGVINSGDYIKLSYKVNDSDFAEGFGGYIWCYLEDSVDPENMQELFYASEPVAGDWIDIDEEITMDSSSCELWLIAVTWLL